jgi:hypothetical protein
VRGWARWYVLAAFVTLGIIVGVVLSTPAA